MSALRWSALVALVGVCAAVWMGMRVYLEITGMRNTPQLHTALVLQEIGRLKPFSHWMYADPLIYSFHADIPVPPPIAVVPVKRLWAGEMTNARIAAEMARYKPEVILLPNDTREVPFQELLEADYRMIYQDDKVRLYTDRATIRRAESEHRSTTHNPRSGTSTSNIQHPTSNIRCGRELAHTQLRENVLGGEAVELDGLVARGVAADQFHAVAGAVQLLGEQLDEGLVGGGINGRGGDFDAEFVAERLADFVGGGARLELHREQKAVGLDAKKGWHGHVGNEFWPRAAPEG